MTGYLFFFCRVFNRLAKDRPLWTQRMEPSRVEANVFHYNAALSVRGPSDGCGVRNRAWMPSGKLT